MFISLVFCKGCTLINFVNVLKPTIFKMLSRLRSLYFMVLGILFKRDPLICLYKVSGLSTRKTRIWYGLTTMTLFTILKNKDKIQLAILCDGRQVTEKNKDLESELE
jgi:hypothetical protein